MCWRLTSATWLAGEIPGQVAGGAAWRQTVWTAWDMGGVLVMQKPSFGVARIPIHPGGLRFLPFRGVGQNSPIGGMRAVPMGVIDTNFHGPLQFYAYEDVTQEWWCYEAKFTDGQCVDISCLEYERRDGPYAMRSSVGKSSPTFHTRCQSFASLSRTLAQYCSASTCACEVFVPLPAMAGMDVNESLHIRWGTSDRY